jgi:cysteine sulfinate desulfinase/cysteine desulfurase-like protein
MLNVQFPFTNDKSYVLFHLDMQELLFHGSACQSGIRPSHVLEQMSVEDLKPSLRISFSQFNTKNDL